MVLNAHVNVNGSDWFELRTYCLVAVDLLEKGFYDDLPKAKNKGSREKGYGGDRSNGISQQIQQRKGLYFTYKYVPRHIYMIVSHQIQHEQGLITREMDLCSLFNRFFVTKNISIIIETYVLHIHVL